MEVVRYVFRIVIFTLTLNTVQAQISVQKFNCGSVKTETGWGSTAVNEKSTAKRTCYVLNDQTSPVQIGASGIVTEYKDPGYRLTPKGVVSVKEEVIAFEMHHILYDFFGNHVKSLNYLHVEDIIESARFTESVEWYATYADIKSLFITVSYVSYVRTKSGEVWEYDYNEIKDELVKLKVKYKVNHAPNSDSEND